MPAAPVLFPLIRRTRRDDRRVVQGATFKLTLQFDTSYASSWRGFSCRSQLREDYADAASALVANVTATIVDFDNRWVQFVIPATTTATIRAPRNGNGRWDAEIYNGTEVHRILMERWQLNQEVTR